MVIVETAVFSRRIDELLSIDEYQLLQTALVARPGSGKVIPGSGGVRKLRWAPSGRGKRGGVRIIYYWAEAVDQILMLYVFAKNERDDLSAAQLKSLRKVVEAEYP